MPDSIIFDLDGTLWDACGTYVLAWNKILELKKIDLRIERPMLYPGMGHEKTKALSMLFPSLSVELREEIFEAVVPEIDRLIQQKGGDLYPNVLDGLQRLKDHYQLFIVSNCPKNMIDYFLDFYQIRHLFKAHMAHGTNGASKATNISLIKDKYNLINPVYVGDTDSDRIQCEVAGIPFVFLSYGFGECSIFQRCFHNFDSLTDFYIQRQK